MPDLPNRAVLEQQLAAAIGNRLNGAFQQLMREIGDPPSMDNISADFWRQLGADLTAIIAPKLQAVFAQAAAAMQDGLSASVTNVVDWTLVDQAAADWAEQYTFDLVKNLDETTLTQLQQAISEFFENQGNMGDLRDYLDETFGPVRAARIASTEVTRASVKGERGIIDQIERNSHIKMIPTWQTSEDDHVCDICEPRDGTTPEDGKWTDDYPPAHVMCRCWVNYAPEGMG